MARLDALSIELRTSGKDKLAEEYGKVIENIATGTLSSILANKDLSGDPTSGTVEAKRFVNVAGNAYGTARAAGEASKIKAQPVVISINDNKEYIEEVEEADLKMYGVNGLIERRTANHQMRISIDNDVAFFAEAVNAGSAFTPTATEDNEILEEAIQTLESTKNDFVNGVPRQMIKVVASPAFYGKIRNWLDTVGTSNIKTNVAEYGQFHGVDVFPSVNLPSGKNFVVMVDGAVAQPKHPSIYNPSKIDLSDSTAFGIFIYKGTGAVMPDLILYN